MQSVQEISPCFAMPIVHIRKESIDDLTRRLATLPSNHQGFAAILNQCSSIPASWLNVYFIHPSLPSACGAYRDERGIFIPEDDQIAEGGSSVEVVYDENLAVISVSRPGIERFETVMRVSAWVHNGMSYVQRLVSFTRKDCAGIETYEAQLSDAKKYGCIAAIVANAS